MDVADYAHLRIQREEPISEKRPRKPHFPRPPADLANHTKRLLDSLEAAKDTSDYAAGFDSRLLLKIRLESHLATDQLESIGGVELVCQEANGVVLAFADTNALEEFEARLTALGTGQHVTRQQLFYALQSFEHWTPEDRMGWALKRDGLPDQESFYLDVELWPVRRQDDRKALVDNFRAFITSNGMELIDSLHRESLILCRVQATPASAAELLRHRDVRTVDLVPRYALSRDALTADIGDFPDVPAPGADAPLIAVLDSGINANHPFLKTAVADAQGFLGPERSPIDVSGHGTHVAGIALYSDVYERVSEHAFIPELRLLSGRILDDNNEADPRLIENIVEEAVRYFHSNYQCRVFNLSYGDKNKPYLGGRTRWLAFLLDSLARELDILFVIPTGNYDDTTSKQMREDFPNYLFSNEAAILDPAPALNAITVGSIARFDSSTYSVRYKGDPQMRPVAQRDQPSPFTRTGAAGGAIKPELVAYGGNLACNAAVENHITGHGLGELSTSARFAAGRLLDEDRGTSFAAPHVSHYAAKLLSQLPAGTSISLLRALLIASARIPTATRHMLSNDEIKISRVTGYGVIDAQVALGSNERDVTLVAEERLPNKSHHFYELPLPEEFLSGAPKSRLREITVALAHCAPVRTTRVDYKGTRMSFKVVSGTSLHDVVKMFRKETPREEYKAIPEWGTTKTSYNSTLRSKGTVQACTWLIKSKIRNRLFVVITRNDQGWLDQQEQESYALIVQYRDRQNSNPQLYTKINAILRARDQIRTRVRV